MPCVAEKEVVRVSRSWRVGGVMWGMIWGCDDIWMEVRMGVGGRVAMGRGEGWKEVVKE